MKFRDLQRQYQNLKGEIDSAILNVLKESNYISGIQVRELEESLKEYVGVKHCITCANGTDALVLALMALGVGKGDAVFVPDFTFFASGEAPASLGAKVVFVDIDENTYNIDPDSLEKAIIRVREDSLLTPKVVVSVDLFGQPADYTRIVPICKKYGLYLLEDGAQGMGGSIAGKRSCSFGNIGTTSFFPAKPLGCYGDGGAIFTDNDEWAELIRSLAVHGKDGNDKYNNIRIGMNSRLDTIQAAILKVKLKAFMEYELDDIICTAEKYNNSLCGYGLSLPILKDGYVSSWAQYTVKMSKGIGRDWLQKRLLSKGIPTMVYYSKPMHSQEAFKTQGYTFGTHAEDLCQRVLSIPIYPYMTDAEIDFVVKELILAIEDMG